MKKRVGIIVSISLLFFACVKGMHDQHSSNSTIKRIDPTSEELQFLEYVVQLPNELKAHLIEFIDFKIRNYADSSFAYKIQSHRNPEHHEKHEGGSFFYSDATINHYMLNDTDPVVLHPSKNIALSANRNAGLMFDQISLFEYENESYSKLVYKRKISRESLWSAHFLLDLDKEAQEEMICYAFGPTSLIFDVKQINKNSLLFQYEAYADGEINLLAKSSAECTKIIKLNNLEITDICYSKQYPDLILLAGMNSASDQQKSVFTCELNHEKINFITRVSKDPVIWNNPTIIKLVRGDRTLYGPITTVAIQPYSLDHDIQLLHWSLLINAAHQWHQGTRCIDEGRAILKQLRNKEFINNPYHLIARTGTGQLFERISQQVEPEEYVLKMVQGWLHNKQHTLEKGKKILSCLQSCHNQIENYDDFIAQHKELFDLFKKKIEKIENSNGLWQKLYSCFNCRL